MKRTVTHGRKLTVAVVVPCRNEAAHIAALLDALAGQTRTPDEILIVNDASTDATVEVVRAWHSATPTLPLRVVEGTGRGPGPAMNLGIRATEADIIMRMDGHALPAPDYLERCLDVIGTEPPVGSERTLAVVGGVWHVAPGAETTMAGAIAAVVSHPLGSGGAAYRHADVTGPERVSVETVPFGTFPRAVWDALGGFDESLAANEDFDFNYRARTAGHDVVLDRRIQATYVARPTLAALARQYFRYGFWKMQMLRKDPRAFHLRQLPPALVAPWLLLSTLAVCLWPGALTVGAVALYPLTLVVGAVHVSVTKRTNPFAAAAALATVHVAWSLGFWRGVVRWIRRIFLTVSVVTFLGVVWLVAGGPLFVDRWLNVTQPAVPSEVIVVLAGGTTGYLPLAQGWDRLTTAADLFADEMAPVVSFSGGGTSKVAEAEMYANAAAWLGIPREAMVFESTAQTTADHGVALLGVTLPSGQAITTDTPLLVVTSAFHSRRARMAFDNAGFTNVRMVSTHRPTAPAPAGTPGALTSSNPTHRPSGKSYNDVLFRTAYRSFDLFIGLREVGAILVLRMRGH